MRSQCLFAASLPLSTSTLVCVVLLANRLSLVLPYFLFYHTLLLPADISRFPLVVSSSLEAGFDGSSTGGLVILRGIKQQASALLGPADGGSITTTWVQTIQSSPYTT